MVFRLDKEDAIAISHYLGIVLSFVALAMCVPLVLSLLCGEIAETASFLLAMSLTAVIGTALRMVTVRNVRLGMRDAMIVAGIAWILVSFLGAIPLYLSGHYASVLDAIFEAASGITTTGLSTVQDLEHMSTSMNMWRFMLSLIGGQGVLIAAVGLGIFGRDTLAGSERYHEVEDSSDNLVPSVRSSARIIWKITGIAIALGTAIFFIVLLIEGFEPGDAVSQGFWLSVSAFNTGGFTPRSTGITYYHSLFVELACVVFEIMGAINILIYSRMARGDKTEIFKSTETRTYFIWIIVLVVLGIASLAVGNNFSTLESAIRRGLFMLISAATTSGFSNMYPGQLDLLASGALFAIMLAMAIGGYAASTAGGVKALRLSIIAKSISQRVKEMLLPAGAVSYAHIHYIHERRLTPEIVSTTYLITIFFILAYAVGAIAGIVMGYDATMSAFESISAVSNSGLTSGLLAMGVPAGLKVIYIIEMLAGRLEFITLIVVFMALISSLVPRRLRRRPRKKGASGRIFCAALLGLVLMVGTAFTSAPQRAFADDAATGEAHPALEVSIPELVTARDVSSDTYVTFSGEVVGEIIDGTDPDHKWVNLSDDGSLIGIYVGNEDADKIANVGGYGVTGDTVTVTGIYHSDCTEGHSGELDVHADSLEVTGAGGATAPPQAPTERWNLAWTLFAIAAVLVFAFYYMRWRRRRGIYED